MLAALLHYPGAAGDPAADRCRSRGGKVPGTVRRIEVSRAKLQAVFFDESGKLLLSTPVGCGSGGLKKKTSMSDNVTPCGRFTVDIVLYKNSRFDRVAESVVSRYRDTGESNLVGSQSSLDALFESMNAIDFNGDGKPDKAYGAGYIGLDGSGTGPKISRFGGRIYWYSIALHGTPLKSNPGKFNSGGCVHLPDSAMTALVEDFNVKPGVEVTIHD